LVGAVGVSEVTGDPLLIGVSKGSSNRLRSGLPTRRGCVLRKSLEAGGLTVTPHVGHDEQAQLGPRASEAVIIPTPGSASCETTPAVSCREGKHQTLKGNNDY
jgi:hypothetical protein